MMMGRIDEVDGNFVATKFVAFTVPTACWYMTANGEAPPRGTSPEGVRIQRSWRSVALAYGRLWLPVVAVGVFVFDVTRGRPHLAVAVASIVMLGIAVLAHRSGRLTETERAQLRLLGTVTGLRIDPSMLLPTTREIKRASLADLMTKGGIPLTPDAIVSLIDDIPAPALPLVYGYARYADDRPEWQACARIVFEHYERSFG